MENNATPRKTMRNQRKRFMLEPPVIVDGFFGYESYKSNARILW
jgi:hypothetical protein